MTTITENHLHQLHREPTRREAILDLFCRNNPSLVRCLQTIPGISDHDGIIMVDLSLRAHINKKQARFFPLWAKADWNSLRSMTITFCNEYLASAGNRTVHQNWVSLTSHFLKMKSTVPTKKTSTRFNLPWLSPELKRMCRKKRRLYKKAKKSPENWSRFIQHQVNTTSTIRKAHWNYINNVLQEDLAGGGQKSFWRYIKAKKQDSIGVAPLRKGSRVFSDSKSKAELLSEQFK